MEKNLFTRTDKIVKKINPECFSNEIEMQDLLEEIIKKEKKLLSHKIIGYKRELQTRAGRADFVLVDSDGRVIILECKLVNNEQIRRKIIAQLIDYASDYSDIIKIKNWESLTGENNIEPDLDSNEPLFFIVSDGIHPELHRINTFLNSKNFIIKLITINKFTIQGKQFFSISTHESEPDERNTTHYEKLNSKILSFGPDAEKVRSLIETVKSRSSDIRVQIGKKRISIHIIGSDEKFAIWLSQPGVRNIERSNISIPKFSFEPCSQDTYDTVLRKLNESYTLTEINYDDVMSYIDINAVYNDVIKLIEIIREHII